MPPQAYEWDFEKTSCDSNPLYDTFSVPVFQWLPKTSGKGLKKSKTIRVNGYTADPKSAYDKAAELVRQFNEAGVRIENPPKWLQKTYSVPRPDGYVIERTMDDLTGAQVRAIRLRVMEERLIPAGFVKGEGGKYVRRSMDQVHLIDFQAARFGHNFTVNLGFSFTFIPPLFHASRISLREVIELDCAARERIGHFLPGGRDTWFDYGKDRDALFDTFTSCANVSLAVLDKHSARWADAESFLRDETDRAEGWDRESRVVVRAALLMKLGRLDEANAALALKDAQWHARLHAAATAELQNLRDGGGELTDWITSS